MDKSHEPAGPTVALGALRDPVQRTKQGLFVRGLPDGPLPIPTNGMVMGL